MFEASGCDFEYRAAQNLVMILAWCNIPLVSFLGKSREISWLLDFCWPLHLLLLRELLWP